MLNAEKLWCRVALQEREIGAAEKLEELDLIPHSTHLSLQIAYLKVSNKILSALMKTKMHLQAVTR